MPNAIIIRLRFIPNIENDSNRLHIFKTGIYQEQSAIESTVLCATTANVHCLSYRHHLDCIAWACCIYFSEPFEYISLLTADGDGSSILGHRLYREVLTVSVPYCTNFSTSFCRRGAFAAKHLWCESKRAVSIAVAPIELART